MTTTPTVAAPDDGDALQECFLQELDALLRDVELPEELCVAPASAHVELVASTPRELRAAPLMPAPPARTNLQNAWPQVPPSFMKNAVVEVAKPIEQRKKTSSQRQKEELSYLRSKVQELEKQLTTLKTNIVPHASNSSDSENGSDRSRTAVSVWERLAKRELKKRDRAKFENAQLKEMLESQIKVAKSLERILGKRQVWDELQQNKRHCMTPSTSTKSEVFGMLSKSVDARLPLIDHVLELHGLAGVNEHVSKAGVAHSDKNGLSINFVEASIMPFDFRSTANTIWKYMHTNAFNLPNCTVTSQIMEQTDTMLAMTRIMTTSLPCEARSTTMHSVSKRVVQDNQVIMVWESVSETALPSSGKPKVELIQKGWVKVLHVPASDGSAASTIQSYVHMAPTFTEDPQLDADRCERLLHQKSRDTGVLTEAIISSYQQNVQIVRQAIENELMDEYFKTKVQVVVDLLAEPSKASPMIRSDGADDGAPLEFVFRDLDALLLDLEPPCGDGDLPQSAFDALALSAVPFEGEAAVATDAHDLSRITDDAPFFEQRQLGPDELVHANAMPSSGAHNPVDAAEPLAMTTSELPRKSKRGAQNPGRAQPKTTSQRQKEELTYLRTKLVQLEDELSRLKAKTDSREHGVLGAGTESTSSSGNAGYSSSHDSAWKTLAESQRNDAIRAKLENAELRRQLEEQIRFADSLQRLLRKRKIWDKLEEQKRHRTIDMSDKESDIFESLSRNVDFNFTRLDQELEAHDLVSKSTATSSANVAYNAEEGLHVNFVELIIMPFELRAIADSAWKVIATKDIKVQNLLLRHEIIERTENKLVCKATVATKHYDAQSTAVYSVFKRAVEENQVAIVFESLTKSRGFPWSENSGIHLVQKGWIKMAQVDTVTHDGRMRTARVESYIRTTPTMTGRKYSHDTGTLAQFHDAGMLTEAIISSHRHNALAAPSNCVLSRHEIDDNRSCRLESFFKQRHHYLSLVVSDAPKPTMQGDTPTRRALGSRPPVSTPRPNDTHQIESPWAVSVHDTSDAPHDERRQGATASITMHDSAAEVNEPRGKKRTGSPTRDTKNEQPRQKKRNREELLYLRDKVTELEHELTTRMGGFSGASPKCAADDRTNATPSERRTVAAQEVQRSTCAKLTNTKLKTQAQEELEFAKSLEQRLTKCYEEWEELYLQANH
ncbi:hypothetical protein FI667_g11900, partial [Globisporangium splendens]